jgi:formylglycine-generating enzyme required for sulfatase activity
MKPNVRFSFLISLAILGGLRPAVAQPPLGVAPIAGNQVVLFWGNDGTNYIVQSTPSLTSPSWTQVTNSIPVVALAVSNASPTAFFRLAIPVTVSAIPGGAFIMGDTLDAELDALPTAVVLSPFGIETNLIMLSQWQIVYTQATNAGYGFDSHGAGKGPTYPVDSINWFDAVKWCNARSQQTGLTPVYYTDDTLTQVYTNGDVTPYPNWSAGGYRLPTEAEWEMASRGGLIGLRFPWGNTISESQANYQGCPSCAAYDLGPTGYNITYTNGGFPCTSPVGSFRTFRYGWQSI